MHKLLEMIISLLNLQICHLRLGISMSPIPLKISSKSSIKNLRLNGIYENCFTDRLINLLQYLPYLQTLHIIANQLQFVSKTNLKNISDIVSISSFTLNINQLIGSLVQLTNFILFLTPCVQELTIIFRNPVQDLTYLDYREWMTFIKSLHNLVKFTLNIRCTNEINEQIWNKKCQLLTKLMTNNHIVFRIEK